MDKHCQGQQVDHTLGEVPCVSRRLPVKVEEEPLVNPKLNEEDEEIECVKSRHAGGVRKCREDGGEQLGIPYLQDPLWSSVELLILHLNYLACLLRVC